MTIRGSNVERFAVGADDPRTDVYARLESNEIFTPRLSHFSVSARSNREPLPFARVARIFPNANKRNGTSPVSFNISEFKASESGLYPISFKVQARTAATAAGGTRTKILLDARRRLSRRICGFMLDDTAFHPCSLPAPRSAHSLPQRCGSR